MNTEDAAAADAKWADMLKAQGPLKRANAHQPGKLKRPRLAATSAPAGQAGPAPEPPATAAVANTATLATGAGAPAPADMPFPATASAVTAEGLVAALGAGDSATASGQTGVASAVRRAGQEAAVGANVAGQGGSIAAESLSRKRARMLRIPSAADVERLLQVGLLLIFPAHG